MHRSPLIKTTLGAALALSLASHAGAHPMDRASQANFGTVTAFTAALGSSDTEAISALMADDVVWYDKGDPSLPWIGKPTGKEAISAVLAVFPANLQTTLRENTNAFASGDTVAVIGRTNGITTQPGRETGEFTFALPAKVRDGQVALWKWFEDSFAMSRAYHSK